MNKVGAALVASFGAAWLAGGFAASPAGAQAALGPVVNVPTTALKAFQTAYRSVRDYTTSDVVYEQLDDASRVEKRTYAFEVLPPAAALAAIVTGPGRGTTVSWLGGGTVNFHQGGRLAQIKLTIPIDDPRVQTLRGDTIDTATFAYELQYMLTTPGTLADLPGPDVGGTATTSITLKIKDPAVAAVTKVVLDISTASSLPVRRQQFVGSTVVKTETFVGTKINVGLKTRDIDV